MVNLIFLSLFQAGLFSTEPMEAVHKILSRDIQLGTGRPPIADSVINCFHFTDLIKVRIDRNSKVSGIKVSDGSSEWMKKEIKKMLTKKYFRLEKLDSVLLKNKIKGVELVIPIIVESEDFPCGTEKKERRVQPNYYNFGGQPLKGNMIFMKEIQIVCSTILVF